MAIWRVVKGGIRKGPMRMPGIMRYLSADPRDCPIQLNRTLKRLRELTMTDKEYDIYLKRATGFFGRLPRHFFKESRPLGNSGRHVGGG